MTFYKLLIISELNNVSLAGTRRVSAKAFAHVLRAPKHDTSLLKNMAWAALKAHGIVSVRFWSELPWTNADSVKSKCLPNL
jgi:hypothetical protein